MKFLMFSDSIRAFKELLNLHKKTLVMNIMLRRKILYSKEDIKSYKFFLLDVVKPTHASGEVIFVDSTDINKEEIANWLDLNFYDRTREGNYKYLQPKIIIEEPVFGIL